MTHATKQDVQNLVENSKNQLIQRMATRQDMQIVNDNLRVIITNLQQSQQLLQQGQQLLRQSEYQRIQMMRRTVALEARLIQVDQELRAVKAALERLAESQPQKVIMPVPATEAPKTAPGQGYSYNPA